MALRLIVRKKILTLGKRPPICRNPHALRGHSRGAASSDVEEIPVWIRHELLGGRAFQIAFGVEPYRARLGGQKIEVGSHLNRPHLCYGAEGCWKPGTRLL